MRRAIIAAVIMAAVFSCGYLFAQSAPGNRNIGIYVCVSYCTVGSPVPDAATNNEIITAQIAFDSSHPNAPVAPGDVITVCSASYCTDYTRNSDGSYTGSNRRPQQGGTGGTGSGGGAAGGGGGPSPPSGCYGDCDRYGHVGEIEQA